MFGLKTYVLCEMDRARPIDSTFCSNCDVFHFSYACLQMWRQESQAMSATQEETGCERRSCEFSKLLAGRNRHEVMLEGKFGLKPNQLKAVFYMSQTAIHAVHIRLPGFLSCKSTSLRRLRTQAQHAVKWLTHDQHPVLLVGICGMLILHRSAKHRQP